MTAPLEADKELDKLITGYDIGWKWSNGGGGDLKKALTRDKLTTALLAWRDKAVVAARIDELKSLDFEDFEGDSKPVRIRQYINNRLSQLGAKDE